MTKFRINITINQPPDIVDKAFMEPSNAVQWTSGLVKFEVVKGKPGEIGAIAHLYYLEKGRSHIMEDVLEYCEPGKSYVSRVSGGGMNARVETILNPIDHGTDVTMCWSGTSNSFYVRLLLPFLRGMIMRRAKADLTTFKSLMEDNGVYFPEKTVSS